MYVTTFYSFKGGVGRTMALVNVAVELALQGKRVVAVDFDLEAPGLDTFDLGRPAETTPGILDFVETYLETDRAPDAKDFLFESPPLGENGGRLWVMPSGSHDERYARRLSALDWQALYEHFDGYLLFEDLKAQWRDALEADYVLIDSRTGHTDVGGICTRQLPDAVVLLFFPNQQNLRGLTKVVRDIRAEAKGPREKRIDLHYVVSNVPDLDDEDEILQGITADFQKQLGFDRKPLAIHRYPSLSLLKQDIFTRDRPRTRLAKEYDQLAYEIVCLNPLDRVGAFSYMDNCEPRRKGSDPAQDEQLKRIEKHHSDDGEVLYHLGRLRARSGDLDDSLALFDQAIEAGYDEPDVLLDRAQQRRLLDDPAGASQDALTVIRMEGLNYLEVQRALRLLLPKDLEHVPTSDGLRELAAGERIAVALSLTRRPEEAELARALLHPLLEAGDLEPAEQAPARHGLVLALLALGRFNEAAGVCATSASSVEETSVQDAFNLGMALWGQRGEPSRCLFARVVELDASEPTSREDANYAQCLGLAHSVLGNVHAAKQHVAEAESRIRTERTSFSCWRYLTVSGSDFSRDLQEMSLMIDGDETVKPRFMRQRDSGVDASSATDRAADRTEEESR